MSTTTEVIEVNICGMDCADCAAHVQHALAALPGVEHATVLLSAERAVIRGDPALVTLPALRAAIEAAGYSVPDPKVAGELGSVSGTGATLTRQVFTIFGLIFGAVVLIVVVGEWLGLLEAVTEVVPFWLGASLVLVAGWPVFANVVRAAWRRQIIAHTLMTAGVVAALAVGQWATAAVVVFFMRIGDYVEHLTAEQARRAVRKLNELAPQMALVEREDGEYQVPVAEVRPGETVIVRPGGQIPVDGMVVSGQALINQAAITGESMPVEVGPGVQVYAATIAQLGSLRVKALHIGANSTFGQVIRMVEEAEANRAHVQRLADRFATWFLPVVLGLALLTLLVRRDPLATAAVLVVACSCSFALATPVAMLASIGNAARRGLLIKGGRYIELLARADVLLVDKTGTLTMGRPTLTHIVPCHPEWNENDLLTLAATAERYSEHPLAEAVREAARERNLPLAAPDNFSVVPGVGIKATINGQEVMIGSARTLVGEQTLTPEVVRREAEGGSLLYVTVDGECIGVLVATDTERPDVTRALTTLRHMGLHEIVMLTGDREATAAALAEQLGIAYRAQLLPEDKLALVRMYQAQGHTVIMVGDGINDAPALAQADIGIAMGVTGIDIAIATAPITLMRDDWALLPELLALSRRTMGIVRGNLGFTVAYNLVGLSLAALGFLPPIVAAAAQSLPDLGIMANSARLLHKDSAHSVHTAVQDEYRPHPGPQSAHR
ncbi:heavy metal translocating P-type ATPase [Candidatus Chloroploca asiatica]|uniref:ATPase P n=1 Tax=Candidatus Chloroploca asiatica TaxID=1506545 RepID=A0A2H3KI41_9CHLR|nr:cation-translocating P-type ATPase [Candidatus Chloroploca asiatica]PDV97472.1 ATPase P [Candidatus Chloroploca asiatica]